MFNHTIIKAVAVSLALAAGSLLSVGGLQAQPRDRGLREKSKDFFRTEEAAIIGDQVLAYQRCTGGWPKNIDMARRHSQKELADVRADKPRRNDSTIDNNATTMQMTYLARLYQATSGERWRDGFRKGVDYLLSGQYDNGGWPQFWPEMRDYQVNITFNDDAIVNTLELFRDIINGVEPYGGDLVDSEMRERLQKSFDKGIECILATQIRVKGKPTVWCQQNDPVTLAPASARAYELPSFCSAESASIVRLLMELPNPDAKVKEAVHGAMRWFDKYKLTGLRVERSMNPDGVRDTRLVEDASAEPIWARFYDLELNEPYVCDRDGVMRRRLEQIGRERRSGYSWYNSRPAELYPLYEEWAAKYDKRHKVKISLETPGANVNGTIDMFRKPVLDKKNYDVVVKPGESIQAAIDKAPAQSSEPFKILVLKGEYHQLLNIDKPNIVLVGEDRASTIITYSEADLAAGEKEPHTIVNIAEAASDCVISGFTLRNCFDATPDETMQPHWVKHRFTVKGAATRTIIVNCTIESNGNDALSLWAKGGGMYYHADLAVNCPGVDFVCPRGWCYATRCRFYGGGRAMIWHDGRGDRDQKFVIRDSDFDASVPTLLGRYHHDHQIFIVHSVMSRNILNHDIHYAYSDKVLDPCELGQRVYYYRDIREGGQSGWMDDNLKKAEHSTESFAMTARWTFDGKWDPEQHIRDLWKIIAY